MRQAAEKTVLSGKVPVKTYEFYAEKFANRANSGAAYVLEAFHDIYRWTEHELVAIFSEEERNLIIDAFRGFSISPDAAGQMLTARCTVFLNSVDQKRRGIDRHKFFAKVRNLPKSVAMIVEIWAANEAREADRSARGKSNDSP